MLCAAFSRRVCAGVRKHASHRSPLVVREETVSVRYVRLRGGSRYRMEFLRTKAHGTFHLTMRLYTLRYLNRVALSSPQYTRIPPLRTRCRTGDLHAYPAYALRWVTNPALDLQQTRPETARGPAAHASARTRSTRPLRTCMPCMPCMPCMRGDPQSLTLSVRLASSLQRDWSYACLASAAPRSGGAARLFGMRCQITRYVRSRAI